MVNVNNRTLLAVLAHPDDESFGTGGTLAKYARQGVDVYLVCATRGEVGEMDAEYQQGFSSVADRREYELMCAARHLGLKEVFFLGYRDSGMAGSPENSHPDALIAADTEEVARKVVYYLRKLQPQVVITFDPIGGYKHPDHIAVHQATVRAFDLAGDPSFEDGMFPYRPQKLYFHIFPKGFLRFAVFLMRLLGKDPRRFGRNQDIDLLSLVTEGNFPTHAKIDYRSVLAERDQAAACHASQGGKAMTRGPMAYLRRLVGQYEHYMRAFPVFSGGAVEKDLFAGIDDGS
jgi:N-acetyl-1-D-myo-inositol-2-amino-2-deoxy-alpha-D-glucopyranoside deacetylase